MIEFLLPFTGCRKVLEKMPDHQIKNLKLSLKYTSRKTLHQQSIIELIWRFWRWKKKNITEQSTNYIVAPIILFLRHQSQRTLCKEHHQLFRVVQGKFLASSLNKQTLEENIDENGSEKKKIETQIQDLTDNHAKGKHELKRKMNY